MADDYHRQPGMPAFGVIDHETHIGYYRLKVIDEYGLARTVAMPGMIGAVHHGSRSDQTVGHVFVAAQMFAIAVHQDRDPAGLRIRPRVQDQCARRRSEERRVGKEWRSPGTRGRSKNRET